MLQHMLSCCRPPFFYFHNACEGHLASALHHRVWAQSSVPYSEQLPIPLLAGQKKGQRERMHCSLLLLLYWLDWL